ncbi:unnamed protein product [Nippostrongylus brasiliensis]|uniref:Acetyltransf_6 domain-containing protein n=1 Tax=Nippostrongylus brasiliensis TaxID=27835 RepID=A0A0N4XWB4_NIPBR|nr:unnamed protein product [Nippostrongylus brasiliensis]
MSCSFRGVLNSPADRVHLQYECLNECFAVLTLGSIEGIEFPGALAKKPFGNVWDAWKTPSIFIRNNVDLANKMKMLRECRFTLDVDALARVLKAAYSSCTDWTDFICSTEFITRHAAVDSFAVQGPYERALKKAKEENTELSRKNRPTKSDPVGFAAPDCARMLQQDGEKIGIVARVTVTFRQLSELVVEWKSFGTWIIVWPLDAHAEQADIETVALAICQHMQSGGKIVTALPPLSAHNRTKWVVISKLWRTLDETLLASAGVGQMAATASNKIEGNRVFLEEGTPESAGQYYHPYVGAAAAKYLYEVIRRRAPRMSLPDLRRSRSLRSATSRRRGMWGGEESHSKRRRI